MPKIRAAELNLHLQQEPNQCASCISILEEHEEQFCASCKRYWDDVSNGLFDDDDNENWGLDDAEN